MLPGSCLRSRRIPIVEPGDFFAERLVNICEHLKVFWSCLTELSSASQGFICEMINKRANVTCDPTIEERSLRSSMTWCLGLVWSACAYRVPCLPKLVLF